MTKKGIKKVRKCGDREAVKLKLWRAVIEAERILDSPESTPELKLRAIHCLQQVTGQYLKVYAEVEHDNSSFAVKW